MVSFILVSQIYSRLPTSRLFNPSGDDMSEEVEASLSIELNVQCPNGECYDFFDLMTLGDLNEDGGIIKYACPDGHWSERHKDFEIDIKCPSCGEEIKVRGIGW